MRSRGSHNQASSQPPLARRVLIVDPCSERRRSFRARISPIGNVMLTEAGCVRTALPLMREPPDGVKQPLCPPLRLMVISASISREDSLRLLARVAAVRVPPVVVSIGPTETHAAFVLAQAGLHHLFPELPQTDVLATLLSQNDSEDAHALRKLLRPMIGRLTWKEIQAEVRTAVVREAMNRSKGSRRSAARILGLSRTAVQRILKEPLGDD